MFKYTFKYTISMIDKLRKQVINEYINVKDARNKNPSKWKCVKNHGNC